jgi:hypothetical protein
MLALPVLTSTTDGVPDAQFTWVPLLEYKPTLTTPPASGVILVPELQVAVEQVPKNNAEVLTSL